MTDDARPVPVRLCLSIVLALLMLNGLLPSNINGVLRRDSGMGDHHYLQVVDFVRSLNGSIVCPQDPTIPLFSKGVAGESIIFRYDAHGWPSPLPDDFFLSWSRADYILTIGEPDTWREWPLVPRDAILQSKGFTIRRVPELEGSVYTLWEKSKGRLGHR